MVFSADFELDAQDAANWRSLGESAPRTMQAFLSGTMVNHMEEEVDRKLALTPGPVVYPIEWANPIPPPAGKHPNMLGGLWSKQKAAYFATDGFGGGIPSTRTGGFNRSWFARFNLQNFSIGIGNTSMTKGSTNWPSQPLFDFLMGEQQQGFHKNTGWIEGIDPLLDIIIGSMDMLADAWADIMEFKTLV